MNRQVQFAVLWGVVIWLVGCTPLIAPPQAATIPSPTAVIPANAAPDFTGMEVQNWVDVSPDQTWTATGVVATPQNSGEQYYTELRITNAEGTTTWTPVAGWRNFGLGYTTPRVVHWSTDEQALYFTNAPHPDGCPLFVNASDLQKLDLATGVVTEILPADSTWALAAAPDGTIAYIQGQELKLLDPTTANTVRISLDLAETNVQIGNLVWSPDSQRVAFTVASAPCQPPDWRHAIYVVDRQGKELRLALPPDERRFRVIEWVDESHLLLMDLEGKQLVIDLANGQVSEPQSLRSPTVQRAIDAAQRFVAQAGGDPTLPVVFAGVELTPYPVGRIFRLTNAQKLFAVYVDTSTILQYGPNGNADLMGQIDPTHPRKTLAELEAQARALIAAQDLAIDLDQLAAHRSNKDARVYFFRWEDQSTKIDSMAAFIQVGLSAAGAVVSYTNTIALVTPSK